MKRLYLLLCLAVAVVLGACRGKPDAGVAEESASAPQVEPWTPLGGRWEQVAGGEVTEVDGVLKLGWGEPMTVARWQGGVPAMPFEIEAEARRVEGTDFFFSVTFPGRTADEAATLVVGGWGGSLVGISSIDGLDASENETTTVGQFENGRWYAIRLRATADRIEAWIDGEPVIDVPIDGRKLSLRPGPIEDCLPFGVATWESSAEVRGLRWKSLAEAVQP